jgi:hypothetical protein
MASRDCSIPGCGMAMSFSVKSTRAADVTTIAVIHPDGVMELHFTDEEVERDMTPCQVDARRHQREQGSRPRPIVPK